MPRKKKQSEVTRVAAQVIAPDTGEEIELPFRSYFPTGSTLLNLAVSDQAAGGWGAGKVVNLVGDSNTGKTLLALTGLMETANDKAFDNHLLIYDDAEHALEMPVDAMFGDQLVARLQDPLGNAWGSDEWKCSETIDEVKNRLWMLLDKGTPFVYILDSYDALTSNEEIERQKKDAVVQAKLDKGEEGKLKNRDFPRGPGVLSETLRKIKARLKFTDSLFMVISQTRDVMDAVSFAATKRRAGGNALRFYSSHEVWLAVAHAGQIRRDVGGSKYTIGWNIIANSHRSKLTGKRRIVPMICYTDYGVDDIGANIDWLIQSKAWGGSRAKVLTHGFVKEPMSAVKLVEYIEKYRLEDKLAREVQKAWDVIEAKLHLDRRRRFE